MNAAELRLKRAKAITEARNIQNKYKQGERVSAEDAKIIDSYLEEARQCEAKLKEIEEDEKRRKDIEDAFNSLGRSEGRQTDASQPGRESNRGKSEDERRELQKKGFNRFLRGGIQAVSAEQRAALGPSRGLEEMLNSSVNAGGDDEEARALSAVTGSAGGFAVPALFNPEVSNAMKAFMGIRMAGSEHIVGDSGQDLPFVTNDDTGNVGEIVGENVAVTEQDVVLAQTILSTFMYSSKLIKVPLQLLQDSGFDIESWLFNKLSERIGRIFNQHTTTGTGTGQPRGIVTAMGTSGTGIGLSTAANNAITADELLQLQHSVDPAYRDDPTSKYMLSDGILQRVRILKDSQGRYLLNDATAGAPPTIWGKQYQIMTDMTATITPSTNVVLFGRARDYKTREVRGLTLFRFSETYMANLQVGFLAFGRFGGNYVNPGNFSVKALRTIA